MNPMDRFQLRIFYDSIISCCKECKRSQASFPGQEHLQVLSVQKRAKSWRPAIHEPSLPLGHLAVNGPIL